MKESLNRRDFLKLATLSIGALALRPLDRLGMESVSANTETDFDFDLAPNKRLVRFAFDSMIAVNSLVSSGTHDFKDDLTDELKKKGYKTFSITSGQFGWGNLLSSTANEMYGAPVRMTRTPSGQKDGDSVGSGGKAVNIKDIGDLMPGDRVFTKNKEITVLARANVLGNGEVAILGSYMNGSDLGSGIGIEWMTRSRFEEIAGSLNGAIAARNNKTYTLVTENKVKLSQYYEEDAKQIARGYLDNVKPERIARLFEVLCAKGEGIEMVATGRDSWLTDQLRRLQFVTEESSQVWTGHRTAYDKLAFGLSRAMLFQDLFPRDAQNDLFTDVLHKSFDTLSFVANIESQGLSIGDIVEKPEKAPVTNSLNWFVPKSISEFAFGDSVIVAERGGLTRTEVGMVTKSEATPFGATASVTFFDWNGSRLPKEISLKDFAALKNMVGKDTAVVVLRSEKINGVKTVEAMRNRYILDSSEIPAEISTGRPGMHVDYRKIPEFRALQNKLPLAKNLKESGEIIMQAAALMGVQTKDGAETSLRGYQWNIYRPEDMCNLYSTSLLRALGLDKDISHWVLDDGTPAFNTGRELSALAMNAWMVKYGPKYGWFPVTRMTKEQRLNLLKKGHVMYGALAGDHGDTIVIYGIEGEKGEVIPVLTKATWNFMSTYPYRKYHFEDPMDFFAQNPQILKNNPTADILWAHPTRKG